MDRDEKYTNSQNLTLLQIAVASVSWKRYRMYIRLWLLFFHQCCKETMPKIASFHKFSLASWTAVMLRMDVQRVVARESISSRTGAWRVGPWRLASRGARDCLLILPACALSWVRNEFLWMLAVLFVAILFSNRLLTWGSFHFFQNSKVHQ